MKLRWAATLILTFVFFANSAHAGSTALPGGPNILDGSTVISADLQTPPSSASAEFAFQINLEAKKSYACTVVAENDFSNLDFQSVRDPGSNLVFVGIIGSVTPAVKDSLDRISIFPSGAGTQTSGEYIIGIDNQSTALFTGTPVTAKARIDCDETTLYGGYNTNVNDFNFLEILNITNTTLNAAITATNSDGTVVIAQQVVTVQPNRRADIDLHTPAGANKFGLLEVIHNGPKGGLQASVSQYDGTVSNFVLTSSLPLKTRDK